MPHDPIRDAVAVLKTGGVLAYPTETLYGLGCDPRDAKAVAKISMRRVRKWGKIYYTYFHTTNFIKAQLTSKGHGEYEPIRE